MTPRFLAQQKTADPPKQNQLAGLRYGLKGKAAEIFILLLCQPRWHGWLLREYLQDKVASETFPASCFYLEANRLRPGRKWPT